LHAQFEAIHPFYDGNGRTGRILIILYLLLTEKLEYPVLFLSEYINRNKAEYYRALQIAHETADYKEIILYMLQALVLQSQSTAKKIVAIKDLMLQTEQTIKANANLDYHHIVQTLFSNPYMTIADFGVALEISDRTAIRQVQTLSSL
jgi:Fic family protein